MGLFKKKKDNNEDIFIQTLEHQKEMYNISDEVANHILNHYYIDREFFNNNYLYMQNEMMFYIMYIELKSNLLNFNYEELYKLFDKVSLIYINNTILVFPRLYLLIIKLVNEFNLKNEEIYLMVLRLNALISDEEILNTFIGNLLFLNNKESLDKYINIICKLREICSEEELVNMFDYLSNNIDNIDLDFFVRQIMKNKNYILEDKYSLDEIQKELNKIDDDTQELFEYIDTHKNHIENQINILKKKLK